MQSSLPLIPVEYAIPQLPGWERIALADAELLHNPAWYDPGASAQLLQTLLSDTPWRQESLRFGGKQVPVPRLQAWYADEGIRYAYSGLRMDALPWSPTLLAIREKLERALGISFNSVLLNLYRDGNDSVAWHSDSERELGPDPVIASLSFGAIRRFELKSRALEPGAKVSLNLENGSILLMGQGLQRYWQHRIPKQAHILQPRINLTFRFIRSVAT